MAMTSCQHCGKPVSEHATACPQCGHADPIAAATIDRYLPCVECSATSATYAAPFICANCGCTMIRLDGIYSSHLYAFRLLRDGRIYMAKCGYKSFDAASTLGIRKLASAEPWSHQAGSFYVKNGSVIAAELDGEQDGFKLEFTIKGRFVHSRLESVVASRMHCNNRRDWGDWTEFLPRHGLFEFTEVAFDD